MFKEIYSEKWWIRLGWIMLFLGIISTLGGLLLDNVYQSTVSLNAQSKGQDFITLCLVIPLIGIGLWKLPKRSFKWSIICLGGMMYMTYFYLIYCAGAFYNWFYLVYIVIIAISFYFLLFFANKIDVEKFRHFVKEKMPFKKLGVFMIIIAIIFCFLWSSIIISGLSTGKKPENFDSLKIIYILDLGFIMPLLGYYGILVLKREMQGVIGSGILLVKTFMLSASLLSMGVFDSLLNSAPIGELFYIFSILIIISGILLRTYFKNLENMNK